VRGGGIKVKLWNKNSALGDLGRWRRMFVELQERGKPGDFDHMTDDEVDAKLLTYETLTKAARRTEPSKS